MKDAAGATRLDVSLSVRRGEIVGLAGVEGNGQSQLGAVLAGLLVPAAGRLRVGGTDVTGFSPRALSRIGVGIVPEDRHAVGCHLALSVAENLLLGRLDEYTRFGLLRRDRMLRAAEERMKAYDVRAAGPDAPMSSLSGGNQQKVVLARELALDPLVFLLAAQPTRGLDVGAVEAVYTEIRRACTRGAGVLLISSELDELLAVADRVMVIYRGRIVGELPARLEAQGRGRQPDVGADHGGGGGVTADAVSLGSAPPARRLRLPAEQLLPLGALVGALGVGLLLVRAHRACRSREALAAFWDGIGGSSFALVGSVSRGVPLALVGLGYILSERANLTNVGGEGQICVGGIFATAASLSWGASQAARPAGVSLPAAGRHARGRALGRVRRRAQGAARQQRGHHHAAADVHRAADGLRLGPVGAPPAAADDRLVDAARVAGDPGGDAAPGADQGLGAARCTSACPSRSRSPCWWRSASRAARSASSCAPSA